MGISIDNSIRLLEDYHKWEKQFGTDGSGIDEATNKLIEVAKKYQKIEEVYKKYLNDMAYFTNIYADLKFIRVLREVLEDGNDD